MDIEQITDADEEIENADHINNSSNDDICNENVNTDTCEIEDDSNFVYKRLLRKQSGQQSKQQCAKEERNATIRKVSCILQKPENERTSDDILLLKACGEIVTEVQSRRKKRDEARRRQEEFEEPIETLKQKCAILAQAIAQSQHLVIYTGAGISTAARIPDYRGTNGIWTRLQQGKDIGTHDLSLAEPTYTHMALSELYKRNILKYVVSQNCDGLHLRSGLPKTALSEVHGNMYIEVCKTCKPSREYWRLFDVTENTARYSHKTMRKCYVCNGPLNDTIVHFGERGSLQWPLNWSGASKNARKATTIVCLGSSLKVLKKYPWLWQMHKPIKRRPNLYIVNLQWTPKDDFANVKFHGKCDLVMGIVMDLLGIQVPRYERDNDPIFAHGTYLLEQEHHTTTQPFLKNFKNICGQVVELDLEKEEESEPQVEVKNMEKNQPSFPSEVLEDNEDIPINYCNKDHNAEVSKHIDDCDIISNIYSINKIPLTTVAKEVNRLPTQYSTQSQPQPAHISSNISKASLASALNMNQNHSVDEAHNDAMNLASKETLQSTLFAQNCQALLTYYQLSNTLLQSPLGIQAYRDMLYPLQTSLLYSGLHSIISPTPFLTEDNGLKFYQNNVKQEEIRVKEEPSEIACEYCYENYKSFMCLFYDKLKPGFVKQEFHCQKPVYCLCCNCTTDEDDEESVEGMPPDKVSKLQDDCGGGDQKAKIQPGWYGKGCRKNKKLRKKNNG